MSEKQGATREVRIYRWIFNLQNYPYVLAQTVEQF